MYEESGVFFPHFQNFSQVQHLEEFCKFPRPCSSSMTSGLAQASAMCEYDMITEGDLFKAPEPIIEEPLLGPNPMMAVISMISSCDKDVISSQGLKVEDFELLQSDQLLSEEVYYECRKDLLEKAAIDNTPLSEILDVKSPFLTENESNRFPDFHFPKSVSSGNLSSMDCLQGGPSGKLNFMDFHGMDFNAAFGMRRAYSEGDIKTLGNGDMGMICSHFELPLITNNCNTEERREKLSRYRSKKTRRNFGRKIKYACRKALADSQPRIRGRFAKTEEWDGKRQ